MSTVGHTIATEGAPIDTANSSFSHLGSSEPILEICVCDTVRLLVPFPRRTTTANHATRLIPVPPGDSGQTGEPLVHYS